MVLAVVVAGLAQVTDGGEYGLGDGCVLVFRPVGRVCCARWSHSRARVVECRGWRVGVRAAVPVGQPGCRAAVFLTLTLEALVLVT